MTENRQTASVLGRPRAKVVVNIKIGKRASEFGKHAKVVAHALVIEVYLGSIDFCLLPHFLIKSRPRILLSFLNDLNDGDDFIRGLPPPASTHNVSD